MDNLQNDKEILRKGRKNKLVDRDDVQVTVDKQQQIPKALAKKLRDDKVGENLNKIWNKAKANRQEWLSRQMLYQQDFDEFKYTYDYGLDGTDSAPEGISQLHVPMPLTVIKNVHARFMQALSADFSPVVQARREDSVQRVPLVKALMSYTLKDWANYHEGVEDEMDQFVWDWAAHGDAILKIRWETVYDTYQDVANFVEPAEDLEEVDENGNIVKLPNAKLRQEEVKRLIKRFDGPVFENRDREDVTIVGHRDPQRADYVFDSYKLTSSEMLTLADRQLFDEDEVKEVIRSGPDSKTGRVEDEIKERRKINAGEAGLSTEPTMERYRILEVYFGYDVDGSGIHSQIVAWIHPRTGRILRATYLNRMNRSGERPYFKASYMLRKGTEHGLGLLEMLHPLSIEMDFHHNARVDFGLFSSMPIGFYRASSSVDPEKFKVSPGDLIPLEDPQNDVVYPNFGNRTSFGLQEEAAIQTLVERMTGVNDLSLGVLTGAQGPTRTARGVSALTAESSANLDVHLRRLNRMWKQALRYTLHLLQQKLPPGFEFKLVGEDGGLYFPYIKNREDIRGDFDFELAPSSATSNPQIQRDRANFVAQMQLNPIYLTTGIVTPGNLWEGARNQLVSIGIKDPHRFITKPPEYRYVPTPEEEANRILRGIPMPVMPESDHQGFVDYVNFLMTENDQDGNALIARFSADEISQLAAQAQEHERMMQTLQQLESTAANNQQQITNQLQGLVQANVQLPLGQE